MYNVLSTIVKYFFITLIYLFIFGIIRMIFLDIRRTMAPARARGVPKDMPYLKLDTDRSKLYFDVPDPVVLEEDELVIGRGDGCNLRIDDLYLSQHNTRLWFEDGEWFIEDLGSTNGTFVNDTKLGETPMILDHGDRIRIGQVTYTAMI